MPEVYYNSCNRLLDIAFRVDPNPYRLGQLNVSDVEFESQVL